MGGWGVPVAGTRPGTRRLAAVALAGYGIVLVGIAFWPEHVDSEAGWLVDLLVRMVPGLSRDRLEFGSNLLLFVPLGVLGTMLVQPAVIVPFFGLALSALIETAQGDFLPGRTASVLDIVANTLGAVVGTVIVVAVRYVIRWTSDAARRERRAVTLSE